MSYNNNSGRGRGGRGRGGRGRRGGRQNRNGYKNQYNDFQNRLNDCYMRLSDSDLVRNGHTDPKSVRYFTHHLNFAIPMTFGERDQSRVVKHIYYTHKKAQFDLMEYEENRPNSYSMYILTVGGKAITEHFRINDIVKLKWDNTIHAYNVIIIEHAEHEEHEVQEHEEHETDEQHEPQGEQ